MTEDKEFLRVENLKMYFPVTKGVFNKPVGTVKAVDGVSFSIEKGKTFGLVGESGCGKTTTGKCILRINKPTDGKIYYKGTVIAGMSDTEFAPYRREIQLIFQDPYSSLDPRNSVFTILKEAICADGKRHHRFYRFLLTAFDDQKFHCNPVIHSSGLHTLFKFHAVFYGFPYLLHRKIACHPLVFSDCKFRHSRL